MCKAPSCSVMAHNKEAGFTLLEMTLSMGMAALMMTAITASLMQFNQHKQVAQTLVKAGSQAQLAAAQVLKNWTILCGEGVVLGSESTLGVMRLYQGNCVSYEYGHNANTHNLTRRRAGGRRASFLAQVQSYGLYYGVDSNADCGIDQWLREYRAGGVNKLHQVRVVMQLRTDASPQLRSVSTSKWVWHKEDDVVLSPVSFIWRVPHDCE
ncbi:MAG: type II secretion system protein [Gammaproteobacteria bacterium]|nr:type II secretion system protein [Gammaproteobacteria bacterium]